MFTKGSQPPSDRPARKPCKARGSPASGLPDPQSHAGPGSHHDLAVGRDNWRHIADTSADVGGACRGIRPVPRARGERNGTGRDGRDARFGPRLRGRRRIRCRRPTALLSVRQHHRTQPLLVRSEHDRPGRTHAVRDALGIHDHQDPRRGTPTIPSRLARLARDRIIRAVTPLFPRNRSGPENLANDHSMLPTNRVSVLEARQRREPEPS
jgi:hypothetical protein